MMHNATRIFLLLIPQKGNLIMSQNRSINDSAKVSTVLLLNAMGSTPEEIRKMKEKQEKTEQAALQASKKTMEAIKLRQQDQKPTHEKPHNNCSNQKRNRR
jgi:hypothetical protein